jgi:hypothetical protein
MSQLVAINSSYRIELRFKYWAINIQTFKESLARKGFNIATVGLVQQGAIVATVEAGPLAYKSNSTIAYDPQARLLVLTITNSNTPQENLKEILSTLDIAGVPSRELIEVIQLTGNLLLKTPIAPATIIQKVVSKDMVKKICIILGKSVLPVGLRLASENAPTDIFEKPYFNILIEPLMADMTKFLVQVTYVGRDVDESLDFLTNLCTNVINIIQTMGGQ